MDRQKFFYKLCVVYRGKFFNYLDQKQEFQIGQTMTQDLSTPSSNLYVYRTPELSVSQESNFVFKLKSGKIMKKTVMKLMCWGPFKETNSRFSFGFMCVVENIGLPKIETSTTRDSSRVRSRNISQPRPVLSPKSFKPSRKSTPLKVYSNSIHPRVLIGKNSKPEKISSSEESVFNNKRFNFKDLISRIKEKSVKIEKQIEETEKWNEINKFDELETISSSENFSDFV